MTQDEIVQKTIAGSEKSIKEVAAETGILQPNVRRILGQGVKKGIFRRIGRGVYTLTTESGEQRAYIKLGYAQEILPKMAAEGKKFDMVFLDPAYYSRALIGGNRGIKKYNFISVEQFRVVMDSVHNLMRTTRSHVYLMLSGAPTAQRDMHRYFVEAQAAGFVKVAEGKYSKFFANGKPVTNVRGEIAASERLILLTKSGKAMKFEPETQVDFAVERPAIKGNYQTQKAPVMLDRLIEQSTREDHEVGDFFSGSGILVERALLLNRKVTAIEASEGAIENFIIPKIQAIYEQNNNGHC